MVNGFSVAERQNTFNFIPSTGLAKFRLSHNVSGKIIHEKICIRRLLSFYAKICLNFSTYSIFENLVNESIVETTEPTIYAMH